MILLMKKNAGLVKLFEDDKLSLEPKGLNRTERRK